MFEVFKTENTWGTYVNTDHTQSVREGNVFSISVCPQGGGGVRPVDLGKAPPPHRTLDWTAGSPPLYLGLDRGCPPLDLGPDRGAPTGMTSDGQSRN